MDLAPGRQVSDTSESWKATRWLQLRIDFHLSAILPPIDGATTTRPPTLRPYSLPVVGRCTEA